MVHESRHRARHGAATDVDMVQLTIYEGDVKWLEPVTDQQYRVAPQK